MPHIENHGDFPVFVHTVGGHRYSFGLMDFPPEKHEWLMKVLGNHMNQIHERAALDATKIAQANMRAAIGLSASNSGIPFIPFDPPHVKPIPAPSDPSPAPESNYMVTPGDVFTHAKTGLRFACSALIKRRTAPGLPFETAIEIELHEQRKAPESPHPLAGWTVEYHGKPYPKMVIFTRDYRAVFPIESTGDTPSFIQEFAKTFTAAVADIA